MATKRKIKIDEEGSKILEECISRIAAPKEADFVRETLRALVLNNAIPLAILPYVPVPARKAGQTRFDQLYAASMALVFPEYRETTVARLLGPGYSDPSLKVWRAIFPDKFKLTHVLLRAHTYQDAFALACDYACRLSLHLFHKIPVDLTVRVMFMSESALRRHLTIREITRNKKRLELKLEAREFTFKQLTGARLAALGPPKDPKYSIFKYVETKDLDKLYRDGISRVSCIEMESRKKGSRLR